jgi:hypothetical protein
VTNWVEKRGVFHLLFRCCLLFRRNLMNGVVLPALGYLHCVRRLQRDKLGAFRLSLLRQFEQRSRVP